MKGSLESFSISGKMTVGMRVEETSKKGRDSCRALCCL